MTAVLYDITTGTQGVALRVRQDVYGQAHPEPIPLSPEAARDIAAELVRAAERVPVSARAYVKTLDDGTQFTAEGGSYIKLSHSTVLHWSRLSDSWVRKDIDSLVWRNESRAIIAITGR